MCVISIPQSSLIFNLWLFWCVIISDCVSRSCTWCWLQWSFEWPRSRDSKSTLTLFFCKKLAIRNRGLKWQKIKKLQGFSYSKKYMTNFLDIWYENHQIWPRIKKLSRNFETSCGSIFKKCWGPKVEVVSCKKNEYNCRLSCFDQIIWSLNFWNWSFIYLSHQIHFRSTSHAFLLLICGFTRTKFLSNDFIFSFIKTVKKWY